jgi:hypothetical protein
LKVEGRRSKEARWRGKELDVVGGGRWKRRTTLDGSGPSSEIIVGLLTTIIERGEREKRGGGGEEKDEERGEASGVEDRGQGSEEFQSTDGLAVSVTLGVRASDKTSERWMVVECKPEAKLKGETGRTGPGRQTDRQTAEDRASRQDRVGWLPGLVDRRRRLVSEPGWFQLRRRDGGRKGLGG